MKILVALKQVPERDSPMRVAADGRWMDDRDLVWGLNEPDAYALEEALRLKEAAGDGSGWEVVVVCAGPERVRSTLREALAKGADRALHVQVEELRNLDTLGLAEALAEAVRGEAPELVLTGSQTEDLGMGATGVAVAELLGVAHATLITQVEVMEGGLRVRRELEDGWSQTLEMPLPALLTVQTGRDRPRYATLMGIKRAKGKDIKTLRPSAAPGEKLVRVERVYAPQRGERTEMLTGTPDEVAGRLVERLRSDVGRL